MSSPPDADSDSLKTERKLLRQHLGLGPNPGDPPAGPPPQTQPLFFIEMAPDSRGGAKCKLPTCDENIMPGELRLAMNPAMGYGSWSRSSASLYHIHCFEKLADFTQADFLDRIQPLTRQTWKLRGLNAGSVLDGNYLVPGGVERLVLEWKVTHGKWIDKRDGVYDESEDEKRVHADFFALLRKAGSSEYKQLMKPTGLSFDEYYNLLGPLAPYESDGPHDTEEWNLFDTYLDSTVKALDNPHDLSTMLQRWHDDVFSGSPSWVPQYTLSEVDEEVGHTVVHFLCTGNYETLQTAPEPGVSTTAIEYRRSMLVYQAARRYDLYDLETYAKRYIEMFGESMSIFDRMETASEIYSKLPQDETWLASYFNKQLQIAFSQDKNIFKRRAFYHGLGKDPVFGKAVIRIVVNIYSEVLSRQVAEATPEEGVAEDGAVEDGAMEEGAMEEGAMEEGAMEEGAVEEGAVEEDAVEEGSVEDGTVEDGAVEDGTVEDAAVEDDVAEECDVADGVAEECGAAEESAADEGAVEEAVNLKIPAEPSGTTLSFKWSEKWTSFSKQELPLHTGNGGMEKDTNLWHSKNKAEESAGFSAPWEEIKFEKKDKNKESKKGKKNKKNKKDKVEEPASDSIWRP
ncbi:hypothetical protein KXX57_004575 [Aspergillus fumigatus]|nr:hypothetical protein KXX57_004575 [Aspergillus fumigatus]KAH2885976.1 hypothetical protein KXV75_005885 [Aspergillus fumigatus]